MKSGERIEFSFWEAGCLIWVGAKDLGGLSYQEFCHLIWGENPEKFKEYVWEKQAFLAMNLYQDDGYRVRVVMGDLSPQESEEWVARVRWKLNLSCGAMVVSGIADEEEDEFIKMRSITEFKNGDDLQVYLEVPSGIYQVEVYSYAPGDLSTGWGQITNSSLFPPEQGIEPELLKDYYLRTRNKDEMPAWIAYEITEDAQKKQEFYQKAMDTKYVDFIIRLSPAIDELPLPELAEDSSVVWEFRKPDKCPLGLVSMTTDD